ncbi:30S ribosomal protein S7 [Candidatus Falkowbacteria bacterium CG10_big_fil_rev_8_21_14_0_10_43_11]|uniref:Small ribosomal subunit protein uS7 n=1 Tax=Candidatus Falkowbacteria bacterium CG10_big_fil_rev_8_21_14_0_10_43_11 TaxID=1974568 RepID=A0A2M6WLT5_9BACT|nr:MAG: 30S ribosomal protein S7 [Candidatus Falkowbacteria bacterium CG10_big_fil_rev_8_21_14_0_10_43_11]
MRGKPAPKREIQPDVRYRDLDVAKFMNYIMERGKKTVAEKIIYGCFDIIKEKTKQDPRHVFNKALKQVGPQLEVRGRRVGGANYQIPYPVRPERRFALSCRWIIDGAKSRKGRSMADKLAAEIMDASKGEGAAVKKRADVHRMAEANKAFAHFARY